MSKFKVPVVVLHGDLPGSDFQVFIGTYDNSKHRIVETSEGYECFTTIEEVHAYIKGLKQSKSIKLYN